MSNRLRNPRVMFLTLLVLLAVIGPAGAVGPQDAEMAAALAAAPASMAAAPTGIVQPDADVPDGHATTGEVDDNPTPEESDNAGSEAVADADIEKDVVRPTSALPERAAYDGVAADLFAGHTWYTPPPPRPVVETRAPVQARAPVAPALPFSYIGSFEQDGAGARYYVVEDDRIHDVRIGDVINGIYRVDGVKNGTLMFTYLPLDTSQGLRLGEKK